MFSYDLGSGAGSLLAAVAGSALTKSPAGVSVLFGLSQKQQIYEEAREAGATPAEAKLYGVLAGTAEGGLELLGLDIFMKGLRVRGWGSLVKSTLINAGEEGVQEALQTGAEGAIGNIGGFRNASVGEILEDAAYAGLLGAITGAGVTAGVQAYRGKSKVEIKGTGKKITGWELADKQEAYTSQQFQAVGVDKNTADGYAKSFADGEITKKDLDQTLAKDTAAYWLTKHGYKKDEASKMVEAVMEKAASPDSLQIVEYALNAEMSPAGYADASRDKGIQQARKAMVSLQTGMKERDAQRVFSDLQKQSYEDAKAQGLDDAVATFWALGTNWLIKQRTIVMKETPQQAYEVLKLVLKREGKGINSQTMKGVFEKQRQDIAGNQTPTQQAVVTPAQQTATPQAEPTAMTANQNQQVFNQSRNNPDIKKLKVNKEILAGIKQRIKGMGGETFANFITQHKNNMEVTPTTILTPEQYLKSALGIKDLNHTAYIETPIGRVTITQQYLEKLINHPRDKQRKFAIPEFIATMERPNLIIKGDKYDRDFFIKIFFDKDNKVDPHLVVVSPRPDGIFFNTHYKMTLGQALQKLESKEVIYSDENKLRGEHFLTPRTDVIAPTAENSSNAQSKLYNKKNKPVKFNQSAPVKEPPKDRFKVFNQSPSDLTGSNIGETLGKYPTAEKQLKRLKELIDDPEGTQTNIEYLDEAYVLLQNLMATNVFNEKAADYFQERAGLYDDNVGDMFELANELYDFTTQAAKLMNTTLDAYVRETSYTGVFDKFLNEYHDLKEKKAFSKLLKKWGLTNQSDEIIEGLLYNPLVKTRFAKGYLSSNKVITAKDWEQLNALGIDNNTLKEIARGNKVVRDWLKANDNNYVQELDKILDAIAEEQAGSVKDLADYLNDTLFGVWSAIPPELADSRFGDIYVSREFARPKQGIFFLSNLAKFIEITRFGVSQNILQIKRKCKRIKRNKFKER